MRTSISGLTGVASTSRGIWQSPPFDYQGAEGQNPTEVALALARRSDLTAFLSVGDNEAEYTVQLVDVDPGSAPTLTVIDHESLAGSAAWTSIAARPINPSQLTIGHRYVIRIVSEFTTGTDVVSGGGADYDNVRLRAVRSSSAGGGGAGGGGAGDGGAGGGGAGGGIGTQFLVQFLRDDGVNSATLKGNRLFVRVRCPKRAPTRCRTKTTGLSKGKRSPAATKTARVKVKPGKKRLARLRIKARYRSRVEGKKRLLFRRTIAVGGARATTYKRLRIIRR